MKEMIYSTEHKCEILYDGIYEGHKFAILDLGTHPTAYVECKIKGCTSYNDERLDDIRVHGGFTFFDKSRWSSPDETYYLGWDYAHFGDFVGYELKFPSELRTDSKRWSTQEIFDEVKSVVDQLIKVEFEQNKRF